MSLTLIIQFVFISVSYIGLSQKFVEGTIYDERNVPIPHAKVFVKNDPAQRTVSDVDGRYQLSMMPGEYFLIFSSSGFDDRESYVSISNIDIVRDIQLFPSRIQDLETIQVTTKKTNPGRDIMKKVVAKRNQINPWNYPHKVNVYIKAREDVKRKSQESKPSEQDYDALDEESSIEDTMNLLEVQITRNYAPGNKVKEYRKS